MKIDPTDQHQQVQSTHRVHSGSGGDDKISFAEVLGETEKKSTQTTEDKKVVSNPVMGPGMTIRHDPISAQWPVADELLCAMERYQELLEDPSADMRTIGSFVEVMRDLAENTQPKLDDLPQGDPLRDVGEAALVHIAKEIARFDSGYYVDDEA